MVVDPRWWRNVPEFVEGQLQDSFRAWADALDSGIELCIDTPADWFPGIPEGDWFTDEALLFVERSLLDRFADAAAVRADFDAMLPYVKYLGQAYVDQLEATWVSVPVAAGRWDRPGWGVELPWRYDWFLDVRAAVEAAASRRTGDQWVSAFHRHRTDYRAWLSDGVVIDRLSKPVPANTGRAAIEGTTQGGEFANSRDVVIDTPAGYTDADRHRFIRALAMRELARRGTNVQPAQGDTRGDDRLVDEAGNQYWLHSVQLECAAQPPSEWPGAVEFHFRQQFAARDAPPVRELAEAEFLAQVRTRLTPPDTSGMLSMNYARPAFDGLAAELSRDLPTAVYTVGDNDVAGRDLEFLYQVGQRNTDAEPVTVSQYDHQVYALSGDSFFIASKALNIPHLIATVLGGTAPLGVVFSVPHRSLLFLHAVGPFTAAAAPWIASVTVGQSQNPRGGTVSCHTYFWYAGAVQRITAIDANARTIEFLAEGAFAEAISQATETP